MNYGDFFKLEKKLNFDTILVKTINLCTSLI